MRADAPLFTLAIALAPSLSFGADVQVALLYDSTATDRALRAAARLPSVLRPELERFEEELGAGGGRVELLLGTCAREAKGAPGELRILRAFGPLGGLAEQLEAELPDRNQACGITQAMIAASLALPEWRPEAAKHLVFVGPQGGFPRGGRVPLESFIHDAERAGVVFHAMELGFRGFDFANPERSSASLGAEAQGLRAFLAQPTAPLGRTPARTRHITALSGGSYHLIMDRPAHHRFVVGDGDLARRLKARFGDEGLAALDALLAASSGPMEGGRDALDDLAEGRRRPSEVREEELPSALRGLDLEPLLDAVWDFVDARAVVTAARERLRLEQPLEARAEGPARGAVPGGGRGGARGGGGGGGGGGRRGGGAGRAGPRGRLAARARRRRAAPPERRWRWRCEAAAA